MGLLAGVLCGGSGCWVWVSVPPAPDLKHADLMVWANADANHDMPQLPKGYMFKVQIGSLYPGCIDMAPSATFTVNGQSMQLSPEVDCPKQFSGLGGPFLDNGTYTLQIDTGFETASMVMSGMLPGTAAELSAPPGGQVAPGGELVVTVPAPLTTPSEGEFIYTDGNDPAYTGEMQLVTSSVGGAHVPAPTHEGHFELWVQTSLSWGTGAVSSCQGMDHCTAYASQYLGPLAITVAP
jgi:hypothetical protein